MDSPERGGNSSSPNADIYIISAKWGTAESGVKLGLSDGSSFFVLISRYDSSRFAEGTILSLSDIEYLTEADHEYQAWSKGLALIARREHSANELKLKLMSRGFDAASIEQACTLLTEQGLLDDYRFAYMYAGMRLRKNPEGSLRLEQRLRAKGVPGGVASRVIGEICTPEAVTEAIRTALARLSARKGNDPVVLRSELLRRGFRHNEISLYFEENQL